MKAQSSYRFRRCYKFLRGRRSTPDKLRIFSVGNFNSVALRLNLESLHGDPFAIDLLHEVEDEFEDIGNLLSTELVWLQRKIRLSGINVDSKELPQRRYPYTTNRRFCGLSFALMRLVNQLDNLLLGRFIASRIGLVPDIADDKVREIEKKLKRVKSSVYIRYKPVNIRSIADKGTVEWDESVIRLGHEPTMQSYRPRHHFRLQRLRKFSKSTPEEMNEALVDMEAPMTNERLALSEAVETVKRFV